MSATLHERIAKVCHEAIDAWREEIGEQPAGHFEHTPAEHRQALTDAVGLVLAGTTAASLHRLGVTAPNAATHSELAEYRALPSEQRKKALLFHAIATTLGCGTERWNVKTGTDPDALAVNMTAQDTTIAELIALPAPPPDPPARVQGGAEFQVFRIEATVTACKIEADSDYHLALSDDQGNTMIAEAACPGCAAGSPWLSQITTVRSAIQAAIPNIGESYQDVNRKATIQGPGFFDRIHGQRGVAGNGIEIHPCLAIEFH